MPKLFWRIFLTLWLSIIGFTGAVGIVGDQIARNNGAEAMVEHLKQRFPPLLRALKTALHENGPEAAREVLMQAPAGFRSLIFVSNKTGRELIGRRQAPRHRRNFSDRKLGRLIEVTDPTGMQWTISVSPLVPPRLIFSPGIGGTLARLLLAALLSGIVSWLLARSLARPLIQLRSTAQALASGQLQSRLQGAIIQRRDEVGDLARSFNLMATEIDTLDQSRQRLLRDVAHELRSPLARMQVAVELAKDDEPDKAELNIISREIKRLEKLITEVLTLLREAGTTQALNSRPYSLPELLKSVVEKVNYEAGAKGLGQVNLVLEEVPDCELDPELIYRAFENLLRNACRFTRPDKGVDVRLSRRIEADNTAHCYCVIRDYGPGVPEDFLCHLFEPFSRLSAARERGSGDNGWGLGTAIAAAAIERHGGHIGAVNAASGGLEIQIILPCLCRYIREE